MLLIYIQNRNLRRAYKILFEKNIEIVELQNSSPSIYSEKYRKSGIALNLQAEFIDKIVSHLENPTIVCDADLSIDKPAELLQTNNNSVAQAITVH